MNYNEVSITIMQALKGTRSHKSYVVSKRENRIGYRLTKSELVKLFLILYSLRKDDAQTLKQDNLF